MLQAKMYISLDYNSITTAHNSRNWKRFFSSSWGMKVICGDTSFVIFLKSWWIEKSSFLLLKKMNWIYYDWNCLSQICWTAREKEREWVRERERERERESEWEREREREMFKNVSKHENYRTWYLTFVNYGCVGCSVEFLREIDHSVKKHKTHLQINNYVKEISSE